MKVTNFNLRVYGLLIKGASVLISHEKRNGIEMTKFPGGGLEKGEGLKGCLIREFYEELRMPIDVHNLFYVNDFLQISRFNPSDQLISFYYEVSTKREMEIDMRHPKELENEDQTFQWIKIQELSSANFTFPIDKKVVEMLKAN
jgi:8-oxo-dGTP diphosphatase